MPPHPEVWRPLVGLPCLEITWDPSSGALLDLGRRVRRRKPVPNDNLTIGQRNFEGTHNLFIRCPWQLERGDESLEGWDTIDLMRGETVAHVREFPGGDVTITWSNDLRLLLWASKGAGETRYSVKLTDSYWIVGPGGVYRHEPAPPGEAGHR